MLGSVVAVGTIGWKVILEICGEGGCLIGRCGEDIGETAAGVDYGFGCFFGLSYAGSGLDLCSTDGCNVGAGTREGGVEHSGCPCLHVSKEYETWVEELVPLLY